MSSFLFVNISGWLRRLFVLSGVVIFSISCGGPGERIRETANRPATPAPTPAEREISGQYVVEGSGANDVDPYKGSLTVAPEGDLYRFRWSTNRGSRIGYGVQTGDAVAVSSAATGGGEGCGAVLYKIASDGSLAGKIAKWGETQVVGTEEAKRVEGRSFAGKYEVTGTTDERAYTGTLTIEKNGGGYTFEWKLEGAPNRVAFGMWQGGVAAASFGGFQCGFYLFDIRSNGDLEGHWGGQRSVTIGTESAKRN